jgi:rubrerythrin
MTFVHRLYSGTLNLEVISYMCAEENVKKWRCMICGYIHVGPEPPYVCPICNAPQKMFEQLLEEAQHDTIA